MAAAGPARGSGLAVVLLVGLVAGSLGGGGHPSTGLLATHDGPAEPLGPCVGCGDTPPARPSVATIDWQNVTAEQFGNLPPARTGASLAYDVEQGEAVWFGGCGPSACTSSQTWLDRNSTWTNVTQNLTDAPAPRTGAMMTYDPNGPAVLLVGGQLDGNDTGGQLTNDTWEFSGGAWTRQPVCPGNASSCLEPLAEGSLGFDANRSVNASVLFGGCVAVAACTAFTNETWWFNDTSRLWEAESPFPPVGAPSARVGAAMAYDPALPALVLFGGTGRCGSENCTESDTWTYAGGNWTNVTATFGGVLPTGRVFGSLIWDPVRNEMLLAGGSTSRGGPAANSTYVLTCPGASRPCTWSGPVAGVEVTGSAAASNASGLDPILVGGELATGGVTNATWAYSALPDLNIAVAPAPQEVGTPVYLNGSAVGSVDPTFRFAWGDGTSGSSSSGHLVHVFAVEGVYNATVVLADPNGSANIHTLQLFVHPGPAADLIVSFPAVDVGFRDTFTASPVLGNGTTPYNFTWNFGSGQAQYGASVYHTFATPGNVTVTVDLVDAYGLRGSASAIVSVAPTPTVTIVPEFSVDGRGAADAGVSTTLLAKVVGGTAPFNFTWEFGDGGAGYGPGPTHTYGAAPVVRLVSVSLADSGGDTVATTTNVSVSPTPVVTGIATSPGVPTAGTAVSFEATTTGGVGNGTFAWTFGDGTVGTGADTSHSYGASGTYTATVWWNDSAGGSSSRSVSVSVGPSVSALAGFLLNPLVLSAILIAAAAVTVLVVRSRRRPRAPEAAEDPPTSEPSRT
jgi:hypothetical protein